MMKHKSDFIFGGLALAVMIATPFIADAAVPEKIEDEPVSDHVNIVFVSHVPEYIAYDGGFILQEEDSASNLYCDDESHLYDWIPLDYELSHTLVHSCIENNVPLELALAVMEQESRFDPEAVNPVSGCYGLYQINPSFFPSGLTPEENIEAGVGYIGELLDLYDGDQASATTAFYYGPSDRTSSWYSDEVLERAEKWREQ